MKRRTQQQEPIAIEISIENGQLNAPHPVKDFILSFIRTPRIRESHVLSGEVKEALGTALRSFEIQEIGKLQFLFKSHASVGGKIFVLQLKELEFMPSEQRHELLNKVAESVRQNASFWVEGNVIPLIRASDNLPLKGFSADHELITEVFTPELTILYGVDTDSSFGLLSPAFMEIHKIKREDLRSEAISSLKVLLVNAEVKEGSYPIQIGAEGIFVSSLIFLDQIWYPEKFGFKGEVVVGIPALDKMYAADSKEPSAIATLQKTTSEEFLKEKHWPITDKLFVLRNGKPAPFTPPK